MTASGASARTASAVASTPGAEVDALAAGGHDQVAGDVEELGPAGHRGGDVGLAAEPVVALEQDHPMAPLGGRHGGLEPAGAAAHHDHPPPATRAGDDGGLAPGAGVLDAARASG